MSSWAERVHRRAADFGSVVTSCGHPASAPAYPYRLEKVKFGVPLEDVCKSNDNIPGPLLVLILKLNKESPNRRDVFRAPGHQGSMKKLIHFLQAARLVNVDNYSVYTIASVLKKFLRKIPNGIFGCAGEEELFAIIELEDETEQTDRLHRLLTSLPKYTQHLLVLLFGTFRVIASNAPNAGTGMTSEALGVSVAPSFFQSCVSDGKTARMEDVLKFKVATKIMKHIIDKFATHDLFGRENYEYYARVTGRILRVQDEWICSFQYPPPPRGKLAQQKYALQHSLEAEKTWLQCQCERWGLLAQEESRSTPALLTSSSSALDNSVLSLGVTPEHSFIESCARLSVSLEGPGLYAMTSSPIPKRGGEHELQHDDNDDDDEDNYADDDDEDDFAAELEISNDDDIENNPKHNLLTTKPVRSVDGSVEHDDILDNDDDEAAATFVKRRYRQNKKKTTTQTRVQHQRRLRAGSKSLDGGERITTSAAATTTTNEHDGSSSAIIGLSKSKMSTPHAGAVTSTKLRTCSRCNRGIRHSSSCSSTSGGGAANGSGMTMEELRAVNRYAESTKSLSYLPQVHERQTARMRTRSEWFLGPKDGVTLQLPNTCSNCCLAVQQQQQHIYLGGGSTRDMRLRRKNFDDDNDDDEDDDDDDLTATENALYLFYKKRQQQLQQHQQQQQQRYLHPEPSYMDTDESIDYDPQIHSTTAFLTPHQLTAATSGPTAAAIGGGRRLFLDTNSGSYVASNSSTTNYFSHESTLIDSIDNNIHNKNNNNSNSNSNCSNKENNHFNNYTLSNRQHLTKTNQAHNYNIKKRTSLELSNNNNSSNRYVPHYKPQMHTATHSHSNNNSHYYSTDSLRYCDVAAVAELAKSHNNKPTFAPPVKLYRSPRKQTLFASTRSMSTYDLNYGMSIADGDDIDDVESFSYTLTPDRQRLATSQAASAAPTLHHKTLSAINGATGVAADAAPTVEEVDYVLTSRFRHSTPISQRRRLRRSPRQRLSSTASSSTLYQSLNSTLHAHHNRNHSGTGGGVGSNTSGNGNTGNIRLSNSAESVQYPARRPSSRRLVGANVPRQYPLRSSLRRNKEKQVGNNNNSVVDGIAAVAAAPTATTTTSVTVAMLPGANQPPSVRNSIAECYSNIAALQGSSCNILTPTFPHNRLESRAASLEHQHLKGSSAKYDMLMDTTEPMKTKMMSVRSSDALVYTTAAISNISPVLSSTSLVRNVSAAVRQSTTQAEEATAMSTITFKAPRV